MTTQKSPPYDCIVLGAGIIGLSTAWDLVQNQNVRTLVLEQFPFPHSRGSSGGQSRIYRNAYTRAPYTQLMKESMPIWRHIEALTKTKILTECGLLYGGSNETKNSVINCLTSNGLNYERLSFAEVQNRWPQFENFSSDEEFVFDPSGGLVASDKAVLALYQLIVSLCDFNDNEKVTAIHPDSHGVRVRTNKDEYRAKSLIVAAGPWTKGLMARLGVHLDVSPLKVCYSYYQSRTGDSTFLIDRWPVTVYHTESGVVAIFPTSECPGKVKAVLHHGVETDPDTRDKVVYPAHLSEPIREFIRGHVPKLESEPAFTETCMYADTPDTDYIIARHPKFPNVIMATGFSGHGFKVAPAIGKILSQMFVGRDPGIDLTPFRLNRQLSSKL